MRKCENIFFCFASASNPDFLVSSDEDEICRNSGERIHPERKKVFRKNKKVEDSDSDTDEETMLIPEQETDYTNYDNLTRMYSLARKGKVTLTKRSFDVRAVYRNRRFLTVLVKNFYECGRLIPYSVMMKCDGVGGVVGRRFLSEMKRLSPDMKSPLVEPWIDLNELKNWGKKGIIYGDRESRFLETVPFVVGKGGRVKKSAEDGYLDVVWFTDEFRFADLKFQIIERHGGQIQFPERICGHMSGIYGVDYMMFEPRRVEVERDESDEGGIVIKEMDDEDEQNVDDIVMDMDEKLAEEERGRVLNQVNLRMASMQLENLEADERGERRKYELDNDMRLNIFFELTGDLRRMGKRGSRHSVKLSGEGVSEMELGGRSGEPVSEMELGGRSGEPVLEVEVGGRSGEPVWEVEGGGEGELEGSTAIDEGKNEDVEEDAAYATAEEGERGDGEDTDERLLLEPDDNVPPLESDFSQDTDMAFDLLITRIDKMLDPMNIKVENKVNAFKGCSFYEFS